MNQKEKKNKQTRAYKINNIYKSNYKQYKEMTNNEYKILWTLAWFIFLGVLCIHFNSGWYLLLLLIWLIGLV